MNILSNSSTLASQWKKMAVAIALLALTGCGKSGSTKRVLVPDNLAGTWLISCATPSGFPGASYIVKTLVLGNDGNYSYTQDGYTDSNCTHKVVTISEVGTYTVTGGIEHNGLKDINYVQNSLTALVTDSTELTALNTFVTTVTGGTVTGICYHWFDNDGDPGTASIAVADLLPLNIPFDMTGLICGGGGANPTNGSTILGDYELTVDTTTTLEMGVPTSAQLGTVVVGSIDDTIRPSGLDAGLIFVKQ